MFTSIHVRIIIHEIGVQRTSGYCKDSEREKEREGEREGKKKKEGGEKIEEIKEDKRAVCKRAAI